MLIRVIIILFLIPTGLFAQTKTGTKTSTTKTTTSSVKTTATTKTTASTTTDTLNSLEKAIKNFYSDASLKNASISFNVVNTADNSVIASYNPNQSLVPASTMKLVTTATALEVLGGGYTFSTTIQYSGTIDSNCVLHGDVFVKGGGDPALGSKYFTDHYEGFLDKWALELRNAGIDSVTGRVIADAEIFSWDMVPSTWSWGDIGNHYGAGPSGLTIYDNVCVLHFQSGATAGDSTYISCVNPYVPGLEFYNEVESSNGSGDDAYIFGAPYETDRYVKGKIPKGKDDFEVKGTIPDPAYLTAFEFYTSLYKWGVSCGGGVTTVRDLKLDNKYREEIRTDVYSTTSPSVSSIVYWVNLISMNLFAEHLINTIGLKKYGTGSVDAGTSSTTEYWKKKGVDMTGFYMNDGCGLSRFNAISAKHFTDILYKMKSNSTFEKSLPVAGKSGTLSHLCKGTTAQGNVKAKSGTMTRVKSYAGYATSKSDKKLAFSIIVNNHNCTTRELEKKLEKIMVALADYNE